jgi:hypothetical protein
MATGFRLTCSPSGYEAGTESLFRDDVARPRALTELLTASASACLINTSAFIAKNCVGRGLLIW